jgi:hypothetical protein|tara:strand:- start:326 stop:451 length:126 start_codon:yes stop_codon:yes gene_type:complete
MITFDKKDLETINNLILTKEVNEKELILLDKLHELIKQNDL